MHDECSVDGCAGTVRARGLCGRHLQRLYKWGRTDICLRGSRVAIPLCGVVGCVRRVKASGLCERHYSRFRRGYLTWPQRPSEGQSVLYRWLYGA